MSRTRAQDTYEQVKKILNRSKEIMDKNVVGIDKEREKQEAALSELVLGAEGLKKGAYELSTKLDEQKNATNVKLKSLDEYNSFNHFTKKPDSNLKAIDSPYTAAFLLGTFNIASYLFSNHVATPYLLALVNITGLAMLEYKYQIVTPYVKNG